jgi:perosamine synthetase
MIPLSVPNISGNEWKYIKDCLDTGWVSSVGAYVTQMEEAVAQFTGSPFAIATSNGTTALHISLLLAGVQQGDLVLAPDITFVAPVNTIRYLGAEPVLIDPDPGTWQMDLDLLENFLSTQTKTDGTGCILTGSGKKIAALLPVHVLGDLCDMERLMDLARHYSIPVVEDATEALGSWSQKLHAGCFGQSGCLSFNGNKIITTGGGGMILTGDGEVARKAKHLTTQAKASTREYFHDEVGYNYRMVNLLAAMGVAQLEQLPGFLKRKTEIFNRYNEALSGVEGIRFQQVPEGVSPNHWLYTVYLSDMRQLRSFMDQHQIECRPLWVPMHRLPAFRDCQYITSHNHSDDLYEHCISLPCSTHLKESEQQEVIRTLIRFYHG